MNIRFAQEYAGALLEVMKNMMGADAVRRIVEKHYPNKEITIDSSEEVQFASEVDYENIQKLIRTFVKQFTQDFGYDFAEYTAETLYKRLQKKYKKDQEVAETILDLIPQSFLMTEKVKQLSRDDLEKAQIELGSVNKKLEVLNEEFVETTKVLIRRDLELTQSNERLRDIDAIKSQFVSVAAHQLRTPLTGIKWTLHALLEQHVGKLNQEQQKFTQDGYKASVRLIGLVNDLLDVARLEEGKFGFKMEQQPFKPLVQEVYASFEKSAEDKGIHFELKIPEEDLPLLNLDKEKISMVVENLVDNAIKYTSPGGSVTITSRKEKERVICEVTDTGIGMPKEQFPKVFTKFFRAQNAQLYQTNGTGLGLYLAKNIVDHHGGEMFFESEENKGSTFTFLLPITKSNVEKI